MDRRDFLSTFGAAGLAMMPGFPLAETLSSSSAQKPLGKQRRIYIGLETASQLGLICTHLVDAMNRISPDSYTMLPLPGSQQQKAIRYVASQPGNGDTLLFSGKGPFLIAPYIHKQKGFSLDVDMSAVVEICESPFSFTIGPRVPADVTTLDQYFAWLRTNPAENYFGVSGYGTTSHMLALGITRESRALLKTILYTSTNAIIKDMRSGHLTAGLTFIGQAKPEFDSRVFRSLAFSSTERWSGNLDVPTFSELGFQNCSINESFGLYLPAEANEELLGEFHILGKLAYQDPKMDAFMRQASLEPSHLSTREFQLQLRRQMRDWRTVIQRSGVSLLED